jgi:sugar phosphate isomerase/epimerase
VHDNNGTDDSHLFPLAPPPDGTEAGTIDWNKTMRALASVDSGCPLLMELKDVPEMANPLKSVRESFERLESIPLNES